MRAARPRPDAPAAPAARAHPLAGRAPTPHAPPPRRSDTTAYRTASRDDNLSELDDLRLDGVTADQIENLEDVDLEDVGASCKQQ